MLIIFKHILHKPGDTNAITAINTHLEMLLSTLTR